jgi:hypothetical protein
MARFNEILVGRYNRYLQKLFAMKGDAVSPVLSTEIQPNLNLFHGVENRWLEGWSRFGNSDTVAATVGQTNATRFRNPAGSNIVVVLEKLLFSSVTAQQFQVSVGPATADLTTVIAAQALDSRQSSLGATLVTSESILSPAPLLGVILRPVVLASTAYDVILYENQEIAIPPGQALQINETVANSTDIFSALWRERFLEDSERV